MVIGYRTLMSSTALTAAVCLLAAAVLGAETFEHQ